MTDPYARTTHDGKTVDVLTDAALDEVERRLGYPLTIVQGSYHQGVGASAGTHDGGGVVDLAAYDWANKVRAMRAVGFAAWHRPAIPGLWSEHIHAVLIGNVKLAPVAARQVTSYRNGRDGLRSNAVDSSWRPSPIPTFTMPKPPPKPVPTRIESARDLLRAAKALARKSGATKRHGAIKAALRKLPKR